MFRSRSSKRARWRPAAATLLAAGTLLLAACGGGQEASPTATTTPAVPAATAAAEATPAPAPPAFPFVVTDSSGASITIEAAPQRIISHSPAVTEILFAIGAGAQVIAVDNFSNYPEEALAIQLVRYSSPEPEQAVALEPDLIIFAGRQEGSIEGFRALGLPVFFSKEPETLEGVLSNIALFGRITGHTEEAEALVAGMRSRMEALQTQVAGVTEGPTVFYELTDGLYTVAPQSFIGGMLTLLKARNIAEGATTAFPQLTAEIVVERNPEVILLADGAFGVSLETLKERPGWAEIAAVQAARVYEVDPDIASRPGPRIVDALEMIAQALYPDRFR